MNEVINAIGRRKSSVARVYVSEGSGKIVISKNRYRFISFACISFLT